MTPTITPQQVRSWTTLSGQPLGELIPPDALCLVVSNSDIELVTTCPTKAFYGLVLRRRAAVPAAPLRFGKNIHSALALRNKAEALGLPWTEQEQMDLLYKLFTEDPMEEEKWRNLGMAQRVIHCYNEEYPPGLSTERIVCLPDGRPFVEQAFALVIGQINTVDGVVYIIYRGRIDLVLRKQQHLYIRDYKTTSMLGVSFWQDAAVLEAQRGYCYGTRETLGEEPVGYNIRALAAREPTKTGTSIEFKEETFFTKTPPGQLDEWRDDLLRKCATWLFQLKTGNISSNHKHCVHKYGVCEYYHVCTQPPHQRLTSLASDAFIDRVDLYAQPDEQ